MNKVLIAICAAMLVMTGCSTKGGSQTKAGVEQRDLFENKDDAAKTARTQQEQEELKRQMEEQKRKQEEAARRAAEAEQAVVKPLPESGMSERSLNDANSMLKDPRSPLS